MILVSETNLIAVETTKSRLISPSCDRTEKKRAQKLAHKKKSTKVKLLLCSQKFAIQDGFIHYQLLRFCQATRLQYITSHIMLPNRCVLQQQDVDCKIADALLKKGTKQHLDGWDSSRKDWSHMSIHLPYPEGGFGVTFNDVTKDAAFYTTTSRFVSWLGVFPQERQKLWLTKDDLRNSSSWASPPLVLLRDIHSKLIT
jgi:hypothetical protein